MYFGHSPDQLEPMLFPECERAIYRESVLECVTCQLRFPPSLCSDPECSAAFQEGIRVQYPISDESDRVNTVLDFPVRSKPEKPTRASTIGRRCQFTSGDNCWRVTISKDSIALECLRAYTTWEEFMSRFSMMIEVFYRECRPLFFDCVVLRYLNIICRSRLRLARVPWKYLLNPQIVPEIASEIAPGIQEATHILVLKLNEEGDRVRMNHGTIRTRDSDEECYRIENEFNSEGRITIDDLPNKLAMLHAESVACFRWCIAPPLHVAMQTQSLVRR